MPKRLGAVHRGRRKTRGECVTKAKVGEDVKEQNE